MVIQTLKKKIVESLNRLVLVEVYLGVYQGEANHARINMYPTSLQSASKNKKLFENTKSLCKLCKNKTSNNSNEKE